MKNCVKSISAGFAAGLFAAVAAQAQVAQHDHPGSPSAPQTQPAPVQPMPMRGNPAMQQMMADPALRQQMMEHMARCHDMMTMMMSMMGSMGQQPDAPKEPPKPPKP